MKKTFCDVCGKPITSKSEEGNTILQVKPDVLPIKVDKASSFDVCTRCFSVKSLREIPWKLKANLKKCEKLDSVMIIVTTI